MTVQAIERALTMAQRTATALDESKANSALIARMGQDLSRYRVTYSHAAFVYKNPAGHWRVVHKLNTCNTALADVFEQGLGEFFMDDPWRYQAAFVPLQPQVQHKLADFIAGSNKRLAMHEPQYNMLAYPWSTRYQQSNQWVLETLASVMEPSVASRAQAQSWLQFKGYTPHTLRLDTFTRLGARVSRANIAFDDHPDAKRYSNRIETVTADSIFSFLRSADLSETQTTVVTEWGSRTEQVGLQ